MAGEVSHHKRGLNPGEVAGSRWGKGEDGEEDQGGFFEGKDAPLVLRQTLGADCREIKAEISRYPLDANPRWTGVCCGIWNVSVLMEGVSENWQVG